MNKPHRVAFAGFRHGHIFSLLERVRNHPSSEAIAFWENDPATRESLRNERGIETTHETLEDMLASSGATIVAIGDTYARRGAIALAALEAGKHIIADKPLCISTEELEEIARLAQEKGLSVGCQLDLVESDGLRQLRNVIREGTLGRPCTISIFAQHPLLLDKRAAWYFEPGQHGGTINDIGIHAFDAVPWLTNRPWEEVLLAREWNAKAEPFPHFKDCAQFHALAEGGLACFADVSYLGPDILGYSIPQYWRITVHGTKGLAEISYGTPGIQVVTDSDEAPQIRPALETQPTGYWRDFLGEIEGNPSEDGFTTSRVLTSSRWALRAQDLASKG